MASATKARSKRGGGSGGALQAAYHHGALKQALLEVAESVLLDYGVEGFTLRECARRAGVSHGAPAHHFGDARGLLSEFTAVSFEQLEALMQDYRARAAPDGYSQFVATGLAYVDYALAHRARFQLMFRSDRMDHGNQRLVAAGGRAYSQLQETLQLVVTQAKVRSGSLEPKIALAWSMVHGFATLMLDNRQFATVVGGDARRAHDLMGELLMRVRPVFEAGDRPAAPARETFSATSHRKGAKARRSAQRKVV
jgi:AcrR family transcriptional regulator